MIGDAAFPRLVEVASFGNATMQGLGDVRAINSQPLAPRAVPRKLPGIPVFLAERIAEPDRAERAEQPLAPEPAKAVV